MAEVNDKQPLTSRLLEAGPGTELTLILVAVLILAAIVGLFTTQLPVKLAIGIIIGFIVFVLTYRDLQFGIILFLILNMTLPQAGPTLNLGIRAPQLQGERGLHFNLHEIVMAIVLVCWLIQAFMKKAEWRQKSPLIIPVIVFVVATILSCFVGLIHGANVFVAIFRFVRTALFAYIFFVILNNVRTKKQMQQLVMVILICSSLVALFGILQVALGQQWAETVTAKYLGQYLGYPADINVVAGAGQTQVYRINSSFAHPNVYGGYLVFVLPFFISLMGMMARRRRWGLVFLLFIGFAMNSFCLIFTGSRAAWIAFALIMVLYVAMGLLDQRMVLVGVTVLIMLVLVVVVVVKPPNFIKQRFVSQSAKDATTGRMMQYKLALDFFMDHPIFGLGMGMEGQKLVENGIRKIWAAVENVYLTYLVSEGLLGLSTFLLLLVFYWFMLFWAWRNSRDDFIHFNGEALIMGMVGFAVSNLFAAWLLFAVPMITLFWFFIGMCGSMYNIFVEENTGWS